MTSVLDISVPRQMLPPSRSSLMSDEVITLENLAIGYGDQPVLSGISLSITGGSFTAILGANGSGKSTLLKAVGICVLLAHLGLAVPADQCELPFFNVISVSINLTDDLRSGFSHFMTEIKSLKKNNKKVKNIFIKFST